MTASSPAGVFQGCSFYCIKFRGYLDKIIMPLIFVAHTNFPTYGIYVPPYDYKFIVKMEQAWSYIYVTT